MSFSGTSIHAVDIKGRVAIPAKFRKVLEDNILIVTLGLDQCLDVYTSQSWKTVLERFSNLSRGKKEVRLLRSRIIGHADTLELDKQGRIILNSDFLSFLNLEEQSEKRVRLVGDDDRFHVWNPEFYDHFMKEINGKVCDVADDLNFSF